MSTDKLQALRNAFTELASEPPLPPTLCDEEAPSRTLSGRPDAVEPVETAVADARTDPEALVTVGDQAESVGSGFCIETVRDTQIAISNEPPSTPSFFDKEPGPASLADKPNGEEPAVAAAVDPASDAEGAMVRSAKHAKSLLAGLDLDTAIRLRWVMRDIKAKRTKLSPVSENDLSALMDLGFVEVREELPRLTDLGFLGLD